MDNKRSEEIAVDRMKIIAQLMDTTLDKDKRQLLKEQICIQTGLSERTIRRYLNDYKEKGFEGLMPHNPGRGGNSIIPEDVIQEAIALRREVPKKHHRAYPHFGMGRQGWTRIIKEKYLAGPTELQRVFEPTDANLCK